jgi:hypothetical protein
MPSAVKLKNAVIPNGVEESVAKPNAGYTGSFAFARDDSLKK